jgi:tRNA threonylcarbamoyladenosine biosynthesis protein TsaB
MTLTLAVDTTAEFGSIALANDSGVIEEVLLHETNGFSTSLFGQIEALLERKGTALTDVGLFAGASGPGSFTGVRVGLAAIKGLAEVLNKPAASVSNLRALASYGSAPARATVIDAKRGEIYGALYDASGKPIIDEMVVRFPAFLSLLDNRDFEWISTDFDPFAAAVAGTRFERMPVTTAPRALAGAIARIAMQRLLAGERCDAAAIEANYVRRSDAELLWKSL